ncbi:hypothetical protein FKR81_05780 [Lentzea tibetensis]|uniref:Uncharacterized protein n=1 Tax=Lentzea tibetensis TaxID=2591470 RepID=A0A563F0P4_9PSEU|nr:hypothetical protein [Lentzea tibetensis]TWP53463.1 hypothetical protein FKR81_05780 [Lentzea tibetensis]
MTEPELPVWMRAGLPCPVCGADPATVRDTYPHLHCLGCQATPAQRRGDDSPSLCDNCAPFWRQWSCPECDAGMGGFEPVEVRICMACEGEEDFERLPRSVRDDVRAVAAAKSSVMAFHRLRELVGSEYTTGQCMRMASCAGRTRS